MQQRASADPCLEKGGALVTSEELQAGKAEARPMLSAGQADQAIAVLRRLAKECPGDFETKLLLCEAFTLKVRRGEPGMEYLANRAFNEALGLVPPDKDAHGVLLACALRVGKAAAVAEMYRNAWKDLPFSSGMFDTISGLGKVTLPPMPEGAGARSAGRHSPLRIVVYVLLGIAVAALILPRFRGVAWHAYGKASGNAWQSPPWKTFKYGLNYVLFSPSGDYLVAGGSNFPFEALTVPEGKSLFRAPEEFNCSSCAAISPDGRFFVIDNDNDGNPNTLTSPQAMFVFDATTWQKQYVVDRMTFGSVLFSPDSGYIFDTGFGYGVRMRDSGKGSPVRTVAGTDNCVSVAALSPDGRTMATFASDATPRFWDVETGKLLATGEPSECGIRGAAWCADGNRMVALGSDAKTPCSILVWDTRSAKRILTTPVPAAGASRMAFRRSDSVLFLAYVDGAYDWWVGAWTIDETATALPLLPGEGARLKFKFQVAGLAVSDNGRWLAVASDYGDVRLFDLVNRREIAPGGQAPP